MNKTESELALAVQTLQAQLDDPAAVYANGAREGVEHELQKAQAALQGAVLPFTHGRGYLPAAPTAVQVLRFHTMVTAWQTPGDRNRTWGVADAAAWLGAQNLAMLPLQALQKCAATALQRAESTLNRLRPGNALGCTGAAEYAALQAAYKALKAAATPQTVAACKNAVQNALAAQRLASDIAARDTLFLTARELTVLRGKVKTDPLLREQYRKIKGIADEWDETTVQALALLAKDKVNFGVANEKFPLWSPSESEFNFVTPAKAATATVEISLPPQCCEKTGLGHIWLDQLRIFSAAEGAWPLPQGWSRWQNTSTGKAAVSVNAQSPDKRAADGLLFLCNPVQGASASVRSPSVPIRGNTACSMSFLAKIDGKLAAGLHFCVRFFDAQGREVPAWQADFDRTSGLYLGKGPARGPALSAQADAVVYAIESDIRYARKAKQEILYLLNDFCQGAEHWMVKNSRPYGCDAYGAVQAGRILCSVAAAYTFIAHSHVFTEKETALFVARVQYLLDYCTDARDRTTLSADDLLRGAGNWQTDMEAGAAVISLAMLGAGVLDAEQERRARCTVQNAICFLEAQLGTSLNADGSFPESLRYHMAAMMRYSAIAQILVHCTGVDWYKTTRLKEMYRYYADMITPDYAFFGGHPSTPTFGDHNLDDGSAFLQFGLHAAEIAQSDPALAQKLLDIWQRAGCPADAFGTEDIAFTRLLLCTAPVPGQRPCAWEPLQSCAAYPQSGITVFRKGFHTPREQFLAVMASPRTIGHGHFDEGSFIYYKDGVPVVADPGIISYFDATKDWLVSSSAHACLQFAAKAALQTAELHTDRLDESSYSLQHGWLDTPRTAKVLRVKLGEPGAAQEEILLQIANPAGGGTHTRRVIWLAEPELILIQDTVADYSGRVRFSLPLAVQNTAQNGNEFVSAGNYGVTLQTVFASPVQRFSLEWGLCKACAPMVDGQDKLQYLRAETDARTGFCVLLNAMRTGEPLASIKMGRGKCRIKKGGYQVEIDL